MNTGCTTQPGSARNDTSTPSYVPDPTCLMMLDLGFCRYSKIFDTCPYECDAQMSDNKCNRCSPVEYGGQWSDLLEINHSRLFGTIIECIL